MCRRKITHLSSFIAASAVKGHPVIDTILFLIEVLQHLGKQLAQKVVVWCLFESELSHVIEVDGEFLWKQRVMLRW